MQQFATLSEVAISQCYLRIAKMGRKKTGHNKRCEICGVILYVSLSSTQKYCGRKCMGIAGRKSNPKKAHEWTIGEKLHLSEVLKGHKCLKATREKIGIALKGIHQSAKTEFKKGHVSLNKKGYHLSSIGKRNVLESRKKVHPGLRTRFKSGKDHPNFKGGLIRFSRAGWNRLRKAVLNRDRNTCQSCGKKNIRLEVHHLFPKRLHSKHVPKEEELVTLCSKCHGIWERHYYELLKTGDLPTPQEVNLW